MVVMQWKLFIIIITISFCWAKDAETNRLKRQLTSLCSDGTRAVSACINNVCGLNYRCDVSLNLCCPPVGALPTCSDGTTAAAQCRGGNNCSSGYSCQTSTTGIRICCRVTTSFVCPGNVATTGNCNATGGCPSPTNSYQCISNVCCYIPSSSTLCPDGTAPPGACPCDVNGGYTCTTITSGTVCCPITASTCPTGTVASGPCTAAAAGCTGTGNTCINGDLCCISFRSG